MLESLKSIAKQRRLSNGKGSLKEEKDDEMGESDSQIELRWFPQERNDSQLPTPK